MDVTGPAPCPVAIIGGGPAGMACALWLRQLGHRPVIMEQQPRLGSLLHRIERPNLWVLGSPRRPSPLLAKDYAAHIAAMGIETRLGTRLIAVTPARAGFELLFEGPSGERETAEFRYLVIATGTRVRAGEAFAAVPGFDAASANERLSCWPLDHLDPALRGHEFAVIGGGDNAYCTALDLAQDARRVHLLQRSPPKAQRTLQARVHSLQKSGLIIRHPVCTISQFVPTPNGIRLEVDAGGGRFDLDVDKVFARVGFAPNTEFLGGLGPLADLARDSGGYLQVDAAMCTSLPGVYAAGDVTSSQDQAVVFAIADGARAARSIVRQIDANAA